MSCPQCGATGQTETFCTGCGEFLRWERRDEPTAEPAQAVTEAVARPDSEPGSECETEGETEELPAEPELVARAERARALLVPVAEPAAPPAPEPVAGPVLPGQAGPARAHRVRQPVEEEPLDGTACPWCGTANPEVRHFCRRCAMSLAVGGTPERLVWWRRMLRPGGGRVPMAGERPRLRGPWARWPVWALRSVLASALVTALVVWTGPAVNAVQDHFTHPVPIHPRSVTASASDPNHPADKLIDGYSNTWWGDGVSGGGAGTVLTVDFAQPVHLLDLMVTPGAGTDRDAYLKQARPAAMDVTLVRTDGSTATSRITLDDTPGPQTFRLRGADTVRVRLTLVSGYGVSDGTEVAVSELEFFGRSTAGLSRPGH
jgi:hypothetical protein